MNDHDGVLTHLDEQGAARMVDVSAKAVTLRRARASGAVLMKPSTLDMICHGTAAKGDVIATARIAGIMAAKRTGELIPLCHPLGIEAVTVAAIESRSAPCGSEPQGADRLSIAATVTTVARTGVEMEALTAVTVTALTVYDMCKAVDRAMTITDIRLDEKSGGRSGHYRRHDADVKPSDGGSTEDGC
ncbi:molybdenum cofactor biosynthesis protein MoaC [Mycobacterium tuberculosis]|nr:molybdenum cofactor biosynthesis protein MoaC [Mycobacterium tuberculosis]